MRKVPFFGDIPAVGRYLFSFSGVDIKKRNLLIFLTTNIISEENKDELWVAQKAAQEEIQRKPKLKLWEPKRYRELQYPVQP